MKKNNNKKGTYKRKNDINIDLDKELEKIGAKPDFINFLMDWYNLFYKEIPHSKSNEISNNEIERILHQRAHYNQRKTRTSLKKKYGEIEGTKIWKETLKHLKKRDLNINPNTGEMFSISSKQKKNEDRKNLLNFITILKAYLISLTKRPNWNLICKILLPDDDIDGKSLREWYSKKKSMRI